MYAIFCKLNTDLEVVIIKTVGIDVTLSNCVFGRRDSRSVDVRNQNSGLFVFNSLASL